MAKDQDILAHVKELVAEERKLRDKLQRHEHDKSEEHPGPRPEDTGRLRALEVQLDQCWDLLRQRRALRDSGGDAREAHVRPPDEVEGYLG